MGCQALLYLEHVKGVYLPTMLAQGFRTPRVSRVSYKKEQKMNLPDKPKDVAHVSEALWKCALAKASYSDSLSPYWKKHGIDHARCLILLGEVPEPVDPIEAAIENVWSGGSLEVGKAAFNQKCRKYLAGLTFPPVQS